MQRVSASLNFAEPDRVPRYWQNFWPSFVDSFQRRHPGVDPHDFFGDDMRLVAADETAWPSRAGVIETRGNEVIRRTGWGEVKRSLPASNPKARETMGQLLESAFPDRVDPDGMEFESPTLDSRYEAAAAQVAEWRDRYYLFCKTGGPYLRAAFLRGEERFWIDSIEDPNWCRAFVDRVVDHIIAVGLEELRRFDLYDTGIAIYDDVAASWGPFVGPDRYEAIFMPALRRMVKSYKEAGAVKVMHHADGDVSSLLDMWVDAGIDAINPVEFRAGMDPVEIGERYAGRLVCVGGLDNCEILPRGDRAEVRDHIRHLLQAGKGGGFILGPHSIGPDISVETMEYVHELLESDGG